MWDGGMKSVRVIARKLSRSEAAGRQRLSRNSATAKVRDPKGYTLHQISKMLGASDSIVRVWFERGIFGDVAGHARHNGHGASRVLVCRNALVAFCLAYPEKVNPKRCDPRCLIGWRRKRFRQGIGRTTAVSLGDGSCEVLDGLAVRLEWRPQGRRSKSQEIIGQDNKRSDQAPEAWLTDLVMKSLVSELIDAIHSVSDVLELRKDEPLLVALKGPFHVGPQSIAVRLSPEAPPFYLIWPRWIQNVC